MNGVVILTYLADQSILCDIMRNIKLVIEYDGTNYNGWQIQPYLPTVQGSIENALTQLTNKKVSIIGAGRTDSGVHAEGQVANFHTDSALPQAAFQHGLNSILPQDIVVCDVAEVTTDFHARFSATSRRYRYTILNRLYPSAILRKTAYHYTSPIDLDSIRSICEAIFGRNDFTSFQKTGSNRQNPNCKIFDASCDKNGDFIYFEIEADSFLRGMVRAIVGTLLKCTKHKSDGKTNACEQFLEIMQAKDRALAGASVPAHGLSLVQVNYNDH